MSGINRWTRGKHISSHLVFAGGDPIFRWTPRIARWGNNVSLFWLGTELVWLDRSSAVAESEES